jgi:predicted metalloprotease
VPDPYIAIDRYWARAFSLAARPYMPLADVVEVTDATLDSACGSDVSIALVLIYYCEFDQTIYVDPAFRADIVREMGDGAWMMIVAHEWGHHLQWVVGVNLLPPDPELQGGMYVIESEMLADCLAGVFLQDQLARGVLDAEAIRQAEAVAMAYGDRPNTGFDHPTAHGFSRQRLTSLRTGLEDGITGCHILPVSPLS